MRAYIMHIILCIDNAILMYASLIKKEYPFAKIIVIKTAQYQTTKIACLKHNSNAENIYTVVKIPYTVIKTEYSIVVSDYRSGIQQGREEGAFQTSNNYFTSKRT